MVWCFRGHLPRLDPVLQGLLERQFGLLRRDLCSVSALPACVIREIHPPQCARMRPSYAAASFESHVPSVACGNLTATSGGTKLGMRIISIFCTNADMMDKYLYLLAL